MPKCKFRLEKSQIEEETGEKRPMVLTDAIQEILNITACAYDGNSVELAAKVEPLEQVIDGLIRKARSSHLSRLNNGQCTIELGFVLADVLGNYERVSDHCANIAVAIIEAESDRYDSHEYLESIKTGENREFQQKYKKFAEKYAF